VSGLLKLPFLILWRILTLGAGRREIRRIADRIARYADRFANAGRAELAELARRYAGRARMCFTAAGARSLEEEFLVRIGARRPRRSSLRDDDRDADRAQPSVLPGVGWTGGDSSSGDAPPADPSTFTSGGGEFGGAGASGSWDAPADAAGGDAAGGDGGSFTDNS